MKHKFLKINASLLGLCFCLIFMAGCTKDSCEQTQTFINYEPVYISYDEMREGVASTAARELNNPGKIYFKAPYIFINERHEGVHIIDNSDNTNPQNVGFIKIAGNVDMAVKNNTLYADSYVDLVAIDISDPLNVSEVSRQENVFQANFGLDPVEGLIVDWIETEVTETFDCNDDRRFLDQPMLLNSTVDFNAFPTAVPEAVFNVDAAIDNSGDVFSGGSSNNAAAPSIGGSFARFTISGNYLYAVTLSDIIVFDIANNQQPQRGNQVSIGWNIETVFPFEGNLLIGSQTGMFIYNISNNPANPQYVSEFAHVTSCDPVVAENDVAYVTLRSGTPCNGFTNQLDVLDIENLQNPSLIRSYEMFNPHGLGIDNGTLFICDGDEGLKVYDAQDLNNITNNELAHYPDINAYDIIPFGNTAMMIGADGFYQYDYSDVQNIQYLSKIEVVR